MPLDAIDIFLESSFFTVASGIKDTTAFFTAGELENIGQRDTVVEYISTTSVSGVLNNTVEVYTTYTGAFQDDNVDVNIEQSAGSGTLGMEVALVDYSIPEDSFGQIKAINQELKYFTGYSTISGSLSARLKVTIGETNLASDNVLGSYWVYGSDLEVDDYEHHYTSGGEYDPLIPGPPINQVTTSGLDDFDHEFTASEPTNSGTQQQYCDLTLAGYPMEFHPSKYTYRFHLVAGDEGDVLGADWEATVISGSVLDIPADILSTTTTSGYYDSDSVCGLVDLVSYAGEAETISGTMSYLDHRIICAVSGTGGYGFNVNLLSLKISNFSLDVGDYSAASGTICVDVTDDVHNVVTSGTYFIIDETVTSGGLSFTPITDGYTMCYDSPADFDVLLGSTAITVHASNDNGDILEQAFYLTSGYIVEYKNYTQDYGWDSTVVVRGTAENFASCPATGNDAYFFTTPAEPGIDLGATIVGVPWSQGNLSAEIQPTTDTIYFYGKTFRIEVRAKDFAGNVMEPFTFEFKIEDEPEN